MKRAVTQGLGTVPRFGRSGLSEPVADGGKEAIRWFPRSRPWLPTLATTDVRDRRRLREGARCCSRRTFRPRSQCVRIRSALSARHFPRHGRRRAVRNMDAGQSGTSHFTHRITQPFGNMFPRTTAHARSSCSTCQNSSKVMGFVRAFGAQSNPQNSLISLEGILGRTCTRQMTISARSFLLAVGSHPANGPYADRPQWCPTRLHRRVVFHRPSNLHPHSCRQNVDDHPPHFARDPAGLSCLLGLGKLWAFMKFRTSPWVSSSKFLTSRRLGWKSLPRERDPGSQ